MKRPVHTRKASRNCCQTYGEKGHQRGKTWKSLGEKILQGGGAENQMLGITIYGFNIFEIRKSRFSAAKETSVETIKLQKQRKKKKKKRGFG